MVILIKLFCPTILKCISNSAHCRKIIIAFGVLYCVSHHLPLLTLQLSYTFKAFVWVDCPLSPQNQKYLLLKNIFRLFKLIIPVCSSIKCCPRITKRVSEYPFLKYKRACFYRFSGQIKR